MAKVTNIGIVQFSFPNSIQDVHLLLSNWFHFCTYLLYPFGNLLESTRPLGEPSINHEPLHGQLMEEDEARDGAELGRLREVVLWDGSTDWHSSKCVHVCQHRLKPFTTHLRRERSETNIKMEQNMRAYGSSPSPLLWYFKKRYLNQVLQENKICDKTALGRG